jgi:hypothetical protein
MVLSRPKHESPRAIDDLEDTPAAVEVVRRGANVTVHAAAHSQLAIGQPKALIFPAEVKWFALPLGHMRTR